MHLQLPTRFVLLDRAIATLGSVGMELYPDFNVYDVAKPYARELMIERFTPQRVVRRTAEEASNFARMLRELPYQVHDTMEQVRDGQIEVGFRHEGLGDLFQHMDRIANRLVIAIIAGTGVIGSALLGIFADSGPQVLGLHVFSIVGFSVSTLLGLWLALGVIRSGRL
jgi:ubiquinone biosynthesis protein